MRATKVFLLAIALIGASGIFMDLIVVKTHGIPIKLTARQLSFGFERTHKVLDYKLPPFVEKRVPRDYLDARDDARLVAGAVKWAFVLYIPVGFLLLLGLGAQFSGRLTRAACAFAIFLGVLMSASWFVIRYAIDYGLSELELRRTTIVLAPGAHLFLILGIATIVVGLVGLIRPEPHSGMTMMFPAQPGPPPPPAPSTPPSLPLPPPAPPPGVG